MRSDRGVRQGPAVATQAWPVQFRPPPEPPEPPEPPAAGTYEMAKVDAAQFWSTVDEWGDEHVMGGAIFSYQTTPDFFTIANDTQTTAPDDWRESSTIVVPVNGIYAITSRLDYVFNESFTGGDHTLYTTDSYREFSWTWLMRAYDFLEPYVDYTDLTSTLHIVGPLAAGDEVWASMYASEDMDCYWNLDIEFLREIDDIPPVL